MPIIKEMKIQRLLCLLICAVTLLITASSAIAQNKKIKREQSQQRPSIQKPRREGAPLDETKIPNNNALPKHDKRVNVEPKKVRLTPGSTFFDDSIEYIVVEGAEPACKVKKGSHRADEEIPSEAFNVDDGYSYKVVGIADRAFEGNSNLRHIILPSSIKTIGDWAFYNCVNLKEVIIPESVTTIGERAFLYSTGLKKVTLPDSLTSIPTCAFFNCSSLAEINIPPSIESIGPEAFGYCTSLRQIALPPSLSIDRNSVFKNCRNDLNFIEQ